MENVSLINNTSVYRQPAPQSALQGANVLQPAAVYSKILLRTIELSEADYTFDALAEERLMPSNNGSNEIVFKRMLSLAAHTIPLAEGIPPASDQGRMVAIKGSTKQYGRVMEFTDKVNWAVTDPLISEYTRQLALKIPETKDMLAQEALLAECQSFYASIKTRNTEDSDILAVDAAAAPVTHIKYLTPDCSPLIDEYRKIVLAQEAAKVRPYQGSNFLVLASPAVLFDLITDKRVKEFMKYTNTGSAYTTDMVIDLFSLAFKKAKTIKTDNTYVNANGELIYIYHSPTEGTKGANFLSPVIASEITASTDIVRVDLATKAETTVHTLPADADVLNVHHSFVLGEECLFRLGVEGHSAPEFITKPLGSAGTNDPLNQRQTIGWKIDSLGYKVPNPDAVVDYMSIPTQYRVNVNARPDLKNQFTDYNYGYMGTDGNYYHPAQVFETVDASGNFVWYVKGKAGVQATPVKMTKLVKPVSTPIQEDGKRAVVKGNVPTTEFYLASNEAVRFTADQVELCTTGANMGKYYIKGLVNTAAAEVIKGVSKYTSVEIKADGTDVETRTAVNADTNVNKTGHPDIDK